MRKADTEDEAVMMMNERTKKQQIMPLVSNRPIKAAIMTTVINMPCQLSSRLISVWPCKNKYGNCICTKKAQT